MSTPTERLVVVDSVIGLVAEDVTHEVGSLVADGWSLQDAFEGALAHWGHSVVVHAAECARRALTEENAP